MKARIIEQPARVYSEAGSESFSLTELPIGSEVELGSLKKKNGKSWVAVTLSNGQKGYLPGEARIFQIKMATLLQGNVKIYSDPSVLSTVKAEYKKNARLYLLGTVKQDDKTWVHIRELSGGEGYMEGQTRIKVIAEVNKAIGKKNMLYGALWCTGGILVTTITYSAASSGGGTYYVTWGAMLFGGLQFLQGLYQYLTSPA
jgi:hypothetical protein